MPKTRTQRELANDTVRITAALPLEVYRQLQDATRGERGAHSRFVTDAIAHWLGFAYDRPTKHYRRMIGNAKKGAA